MKKAPILFIAASLLLSACSGGGEKATVQRTFDPNVLPEEYGLVRNGIDVELYRPDIDRCLSQFYEGFALPEFEPDRQRFPTEPELVSYLVRQLVGYGQEDYAKYQAGDKEADVSNLLCDRQLYVDNYQTHLRYVLSIAFSLKAETITAFVADLKAKMENNPFELLMLISSADALAEYLKPFLDADGVNYDADKLLAAANAVVGFIMGPGSILLAFAVSGLDRFKRLFAMHMPETNYALLAY